MDDRQLFHTVAERSGLTVEEAGDLTRATLRTLADRLSNGEARHLSEQLPAGLREYVPPRNRIDRFDFPELVRRVSKRVGLSAHETEIGAWAVLTTLNENLTVFDHVLAQLPNDFRPAGSRPRS